MFFNVIAIEMVSVTSLFEDENLLLLGLAEEPGPLAFFLMSIRVIFVSTDIVNVLPLKLD